MLGVAITVYVVAQVFGKDVFRQSKAKPDKESCMLGWNAPKGQNSKP